MCSFKCCGSDGARVCPLPRFGLPKVPVVCCTVAEGAHRLREPSHAEAEHAVGEAVDDTVAEAVAYGQPGGDEGEGGTIQHVGALQQKVNDVGQPEHVENTGDAKEHHGVATIRSMPSVVAPAAAPVSSLHFLAGETCPPLTDLPVVLLANAKNMVISKADHKRRRCVEQTHHEAREESAGGPGVSAPLKNVSVIARLTPPKERGQEDQAGVDPDKGDAASQPARCHQLVIRERFSYRQVAVHADTSQARHRNTLQNGDNVAEDLACDGFLDTSRVMEEGQGGHQAAQAHQQVSVGHGLDEVTGGVVV